MIAIRIRVPTTTAPMPNVPVPVLIIPNGEPPYMLLHSFNFKFYVY
jgi:hypothetical protein